MSELPKTYTYSITKETYCPICGNTLLQLPTDCIGLFCTRHKFCPHCELRFHIEKAGKWHKLSWRKIKEDKY